MGTVIMFLITFVSLDFNSHYEMLQGTLVYILKQKLQATAYFLCLPLQQLILMFTKPDQILKSVFYLFPECCDLSSLIPSGPCERIRPPHFH